MYKVLLTTSDTIRLIWQCYLPARSAATVNYKGVCHGHIVTTAGRARYGIEWNGNFGMEYGRYQNAMEWKILRMDWKAIFHSSIQNPILDFAYGIYRKIFTDSDNQKYAEAFSSYCNYLSRN